ncbi:Ethylene response sensor 2 [Hirschfeldia incana]|nr:Ethylene response sensor 2 [Hirschfeldia incana]
MLKTLLLHLPLSFFFLTSPAAGSLSICNCDDEDSFFTFEAILQSQKAGDFLIAVAYFSIPIELLYFVSRTNVPSPYNWVVCEFIAFIVLCGMTHLLAGFTYGPHWAWITTAVTVFKMLTGIVSFLTAISLVTLLPLLLKAKVREFMLSKKTRELGREVGIIMKQTETSLHVRMLTSKIRTSLDRHTILYTTLVELSKTLGLKNCAVWIPNEIKTEMNLTHELRHDNVGNSSGGCGYNRFSIPITESDVVRIKRSEEVNMLSSGSALASVTSRGKPGAGQTVGIRVPMLRVCNFKGGTPEAIHMCYAILVCVLPSRSWTYPELEIVKVVADQVAVAISHAVILEESQLMREKLAEQNRALQVARENALRANQAKAEFEEMMGDAMRRPVRSILGLLPVMTRDGGLREDQKVIVDAMGRTGELLLHLVNNAGDITRPVGETHCFNLRSVVKETACLARCLCVGNGFGFSTGVDRALPDYVVGDGRKVFQVVLHMIGGLVNRKIKGDVTFLVSLENSGNSGVDSQEAVWRQCYSKECIKVKFGFEVAGPSFNISEEDIEKLMQGNIRVVEDGSGLVKSLSVVFRFQLRRSMLSQGGGYSGETIRTATPPSTSNDHWRQEEMA